MVSPGGEGVFELRESRFEKFDMNESTVGGGGHVSEENTFWGVV